MTADADATLARIDATLAGDGGTVNDYSVSPCAMRWAPAPPAPDEHVPGAWAETILEEARQRYAEAFNQLARPVVAAAEMTMAAIEEVAAVLRPVLPTRLRCHPSVIQTLAQFDTGRDWWPGAVPPDLVRIDIIADTGMEPGAWELMRGDELVGQGVIA